MWTSRIALRARPLKHADAATASAGYRRGVSRGRLPSLPVKLAGPAIRAASPWFTWTSVLACTECRPPGTAVHGAPGVRGAGVVLGAGS
jgi:hypothetical protein